MSTEITDEQLDRMEHQKRAEFVLANTETLSAADLADVPNDQLADVFGETLRKERRQKKQEILANSHHFTESMLEDMSDEAINEAHQRVVPAHDSAIPRGDFQANARRRSDPYAEREKPIAERMKKHIAWGPRRHENSPYDDDSSASPSANAAGRGGDVGPATGGSFADFQANAAEQSDDVRDVRLVDDPANGERVRTFDTREPGALEQADGAGAERVRIVDLDENPERAVDADPVYIDDSGGSAGTYASFNAQPETAIVPVNPEKLE